MRTPASPAALIDGQVQPWVPFASNRPSQFGPYMPCHSAVACRDSCCCCSAFRWTCSVLLALQMAVLLACPSYCAAQPPELPEVLRWVWPAAATPSTDAKPVASYVRASQAVNHCRLQVRSVAMAHLMLCMLCVALALCCHCCRASSTAAVLWCMCGSGW